MKRLYLATGFFLIVIYLLFTGTREHLTSGPPTLVSLQKDTQELDQKFTKLNDEFQTMKQQAEAGAKASSIARMQLNAQKKSDLSSPKTLNVPKVFN